MLTFLAVSVMDQVVVSAATKLGHSFRMSGWKKRGYIWCAIGGVSFCCFDAVTDGTARRPDAIQVPSRFAVAVSKNNAGLSGKSQ